MTDKLHCPFCGAELIHSGSDYTCLNYKCKGWEVYVPLEIWQALIDGKKAQEDLSCMKHNYSVLSEQREIAYQNYLKITGDLQARLQKTRDALKEIKEYLDERFIREKDGFLVNWDVVARWIHDTITYSTKQENE